MIILNKEEAFEFLDNLAKGVAELFGPQCETIIHDMDNPNHKILAIYNNGVSGREVGSTENIYGEERKLFIDEEINEDYINHLVITKSGKTIKTTTILFKGDGYKFAFGINFDFTSFSEMSTFLNSFLHVKSDLVNAINETKVNNNLEQLIDGYIAECNKPVNKMNKSDRLNIIRKLYELNVFNLQKSVPYVAEKLNITRFTVYNYIKEIEKELH